MGLVRRLVLAVLVLSWLAMIGLMVKEYGTVPSAEQLADDRHVRPPLPADLTRNILTSALELAAIAALLWPWWRRFYTRRALAAFVVLCIWFVYSAPMSLNRMELQHRRWLALAVLLALAAAFSSAIHYWKSYRDEHR